jgi:hypothetical protein
MLGEGGPPAEEGPQAIAVANMAPVKNSRALFCILDIEFLEK